jgi:hypothetical protein
MKRVTIRAAWLACVVATPLWAQDNPKPDVDLKVMVLMNGFYTSGKTNNVDLPQVAVPPSTADSIATDGLGATIRQSRVTAHAFLSGFAVGTSMLNWTWISGGDSNPRTADEPSRS